jgi:hypothetical protein
MSTEETLRVGDEEREAAAAMLGEHYAAGRITKDEYDERVEQVWAARFGADLRPLFADLPPAASGLVEARAAGAAAARRGRPLWPVMLAAGALVAGVAVVVLLTVPWLLLAFAFFLMCGGPRHSWGGGPRGGWSGGSQRRGGGSQRWGGSPRWGADQRWTGVPREWSGAAHGWHGPGRGAR